MRSRRISNCQGPVSRHAIVFFDLCDQFELAPYFRSYSDRFSNLHSGSSAFRQTTTTAVSMSLTGSCFSSESAPGPSIMGVEDEAEQSTKRPCR
jgi:hypothetical protein